MTEILCIGSVLWDIIGRAKGKTSGLGFDIPGRIEVLPGGVAMNIAMVMRKLDIPLALLTHLGRDKAGDDLLLSAQERGMNTDYIYRSGSFPTDQYMAIEVNGDVQAAIADAHSLEACEQDVIAPLRDGTLGSVQNPFGGLIVLDGNLTTETLSQIATAPEFQNADIRLAPASPGKAERLKVFKSHPNTTIYVNFGEACTIAGCEFTDATDAAAKLNEMGFSQAIVTDGARMAAMCKGSDTFNLVPPKIEMKRATGAGDSFMAAHICAQMRGDTDKDAFQAALDLASNYVSGKIDL